MKPSLKGKKHNEQHRTATVRRALYVDEYGSEEIKAALNSGKISVWKAYYVTKREQNKKFWAAVHAFRKGDSKP
jgi:hypothetical protein